MSFDPLEQQLRTSILESPIPTAAVCDEGVFRLINEPFAELLGYSREQVEGKLNYIELTHPDDLDFDLSQHRLLISGDILRYSLEKRYIRADGNIVWVHLTVGRLRGCSIAYVSDITSQKEAAALAQLKDDLLRAIQAKEFVLWFQPIFNLATGCIEAQEALIRWNHRDGMRFPNYFMPFARHLSLESYICRIVLDMACSQLKAWELGQDSKGWSVAINVEPTTLALPTFEEMIQSAVSTAGVRPSQLWLEIVEVQELDLEALLDRLQRLAQQHNIAIDDYGAGYSNLAALERYPVKALKLDRTIVNGVSANTRMAMVLHSTIDLAHQLGLEIIAEGIETEADLDWLTKHNCNFGQGYLLGRPAAAV